MKNYILLFIFVVYAFIFAQDSLNVRLVGRCDIEGFAQGIFVCDSYAYVAAGNAGLRIIDISDINNPYEIGYCTDTAWFARKVVVDDIYAYVADIDSGLRIIDISDPTSPVEISKYLFDIWDIVIKDTLAYLTGGGSYIVNIANPYSPFQVGYMPVPGNGISVVDSYAYIADYWYGIYIMDITDPTTPIQVGSYGELDTPVSAWSVVIYGEYAYVSWDYSTNGIIILNISDPEHISLCGSYTPGYSSYENEIVDSFIYTASAGYGLRILNISNPLYPYEVGYYDTDDIALGIFIKPPYAYVVDRYDGLYILDISHLTEISESEIKIPEKLVISAHPNPFNSSCAITLSCHSRENGNPEGWVDVEIYNLRGNIVNGGLQPFVRNSGLKPAVDATTQSSTNRTFTWTPDKNIPSGIYFVRARTGDWQTTTKRIVYLK